MPRVRERPFARVVHREILLMGRSHSLRWIVLTCVALAWLPRLLPSLRAGRIALAPGAQSDPLAVALLGVLLPLLGLLFGVQSLAPEIEDRTLVPLVVGPCHRTAVYLGKAVARIAVLTGALVVAFASNALVGASAGVLHLGASAILLGGCSVGLGMLLAVLRPGRLPAFVGALLLWLTFVFVLDAVLLAAVVMQAPPPPETVGSHGHAELVVPSSGSEADLPPWLAAIDPVDLFRLSATRPAPALVDAAPGTAPPVLPWTVVVAGWLLWWIVPALWGIRRLRTLPLA